MNGRPVRVFFERAGDARFLSHLDFLRVVERAIRRSGLVVDYTEGFNPRIRITLPQATPVGVACRGDCFGIRIAADMTIDAIQRSFEGVFPEGIRVLRVEEGLPPRFIEPVWLHLRSNDGPAAAQALAAALREDEDVRYARSFARDGAVHIELERSAAGNVPLKIKECTEHVATALSRLGFNSGLGELTRICGQEAAGFEHALAPDDAALPPLT
jgi:hypothetical protein